MVHAVYPSLILLVLILFFKRRQYLAPIEVVAAYLFSCILFMVTVAVLSITAFVPELVRTTTDWELLSYVYLNRLIVIPLLIVLLLNLQKGTRSWLRRILLMVVWGGILTGLEWMSDYFGLVKHTGWRIEFSPLLWAVLLLLPAGFLRWFQSVGRKEQMSDDVWAE